MLWSENWIFFTVWAEQSADTAMGKYQEAVAGGNRNINMTGAVAADSDNPSHGLL